MIKKVNQCNTTRLWDSYFRRVRLGVEAEDELRHFKVLVECEGGKVGNRSNGYNAEYLPYFCPLDLMN